MTKNSVIFVGDKVTSTGNTIVVCYIHAKLNGVLVYIYKLEDITFYFSY